MRKANTLAKVLPADKAGKNFDSNFLNTLSLPQKTYS